MKRFRLVEIDHDTCHVMLDDTARPEIAPHLFLLFTCDPEKAKSDPRCWAACVRDPGNTKRAAEFLIAGWSDLLKSVGFKDTPRLIVGPDA